jgi:hypothetical protein
MTAVQLNHRSSIASLAGNALVAVPSYGVSASSALMRQRLGSLQQLSPTAAVKMKTPATVEETLFDALAAFKMRTSAVSMHIDLDWRDKLFRQLDNLLELDNWECEDIPPTLDSYSTFLRMLVFLRPRRRPGLGATGDGRLIATWTEDELERGAGLTAVHRLKEVLSPYRPARWFDNGPTISSRG